MEFYTKYKIVCYRLHGFKEVHETMTISEARAVLRFLAASAGAQCDGGYIERILDHATVGVIRRVGKYWRVICVD